MSAFPQPIAYIKTPSRQPPSCYPPSPGTWLKGLARRCCRALFSFLLVAGFATGAEAQILINAGGPVAGNFSADASFSGGTVAANTTAAIDTSAADNPAPSAVYLDERYGDFGYTIANLAPAARYRVRLHFVESYWTASGQRMFNVAINGSPVLANFDIFATTGAKNKLVIREFVVPADASGNLTIQFATVVNNAKVDAIEVLPVPIMAINAGGPAVGNYVADTASNGGRTAKNAKNVINTAGITNAAPQAAYADERYGNFSYTFAKLTPSAKYHLRLHFVETYWTSTGQRIFNVSINGAQVLSKFDIFAAAGAANRPVIREFDAAATANGNITIQFTTVVNNAKVDALELYTGNTRDGVVATLPAPTGLSAVPGNGAATLTWSAVSGAASYNVKRATTSSGPFSTVASNVTATSYTNSGLTNGTTYYFVVSAVGSAGESADSPVVSVTPVAPAATLPGAPATLSAIAGDSSASLSWSAVSGASSYNVKRGTASSGPFTTIASNITSPAYNSSGLANGSTYWFVVSAVNSAGEGANSAAASVTPVAAVSTTPSTLPIGINIGAPGDWVPDRIYADVVRMARDFVAVNSGGAGTQVAVDSNGWPTSDFSFYVWADIDQMHGTYGISFLGQATVTGNGLSNLTLAYDATTNTTSGTFQVTNAGTSILSMNFAGTRRTANSSAGSGITQLKIMRPVSPGATQPHPVTELFNRALKSEIAKFQAVRFMDFLATNSTIQTNWSDRPLPSWASFNRNPGNAYGWQGIGGPLEHVVRFANEMGVDPWINIPVRATDDYVLKVAQLLAYGSDGVNPYTGPQSNPVYPPLNPALHVYVEFSNELWNTASAFQQTQDNCKAASNELVSSGGNTPINYDKSWNGVAWGGSGFDWPKCWRRAAKRTVEISNIFRTVFGDAGMMARVRPVLMSQFGFAGGPLFAQLQMMLGYYDNLDGNYVATPRPPSYYIYGAGGSSYYSPSTSVTSLDALFADPMFNPAGVTPLFQQDMDLVAAMGVKRIAYEGGPSLDRTGGTRDAIAALAVNDSRMTTTVMNLHNAWSANGGDLLVYYTAVGDFQWGFTNSLYNLSTPKLAAIDRLRSATPPALAYGTAIPGSVAASAASICARGWGCTPLNPATFSPGIGNLVWANYLFRAGTSGARTVTLSFSSASAAQVALYVDGVLAGTQSTSGGALVFNAGTLAAGIHGVTVKVLSGSFTLSSVAVQ